MNRDEHSLPLVLAGPLLRHATPQRLVFWLAVSEPLRVRFSFVDEQSIPRNFELEPGQQACRFINAGKHLHYLLIDVAFDQPLPEDSWIGYTLALQRLEGAETTWIEASELAPGLCYPGQKTPGFILPSHVGSLLHGSCRKPHHLGGDGLVEADRLLARCFEQKSLSIENSTTGASATIESPTWPSALLLTGDQIYADDVAGPMLHAIHQVIEMLGLPNESLADGAVTGVASAEEVRPVKL